MALPLFLDFENIFVILVEEGGKISAKRYFLSMKSFCFYFIFLPISLKASNQINVKHLGPSYPYILKSWEEKPECGDFKLAKRLK